jgi:hypothetical protein
MSRKDFSPFGTGVMERRTYHREVWHRIWGRIKMRLIEIIIVVLGNALGLYGNYRFQAFRLGANEAKAGLEDNVAVLLFVEGIIAVLLFFNLWVNDVPKEIYEEQENKIERMKREIGVYETNEKEKEKIKQAEGVSFEAHKASDKKSVGIKVLNTENEVIGPDIILHKIDDKDLEQPFKIGDHYSDTRVRVDIPVTFVMLELGKDYAFSPFGRAIQIEDGEHILVTQVGGWIGYIAIYRREISWKVSVDIEKQELNIEKLEEQRLFGKTEKEND